MTASRPPHEPITGGCLCGQVRYIINFPTAGTWPPNSSNCQCTQCRKAGGSLVAPWLVVPICDLAWSQPNTASIPFDFHSNFPPAPFREFQSSPSARRGFCSDCGSTLSFHDQKSLEEIEIATGTMDEKWFIGDRTERVGSEELAREGRWAEVIKEEGDLGKAIAAPKRGSFWYRNTIAGVTDQGVFGARWVEDTARGLRIPD